jgi:hypothetical protein
MTIKCDGLVIDVWHFITGAPVNVPMSGTNKYERTSHTSFLKLALFYSCFEKLKWNIIGKQYLNVISLSDSVQCYFILVLNYYR